MRYAYIKYGDVVNEVRNAGPDPDSVPKGGPGTFTASFLQVVGENPALLISWGRPDKRSEKYEVGSIKAYTYRRPHRLLKTAAAIKIFVRLLAFRPDLTLCVHDGPGLWATFLACNILGVPFFHSRQRAIRVGGDSWRRRATAVIDSFVLRRAAGVVCHGPFARSQLVEIGVSNSRIIEFDIHFDDIFDAMRESSNAEASEQLYKPRYKKVVFLGRIEESKGVFELLDACVPIFETRQEVELVYVGDGGGLLPLKARVEREGLSARVKFTGRIPHEQIGSQLGNATVLVTPTRRGLEGWPMAALEGLALGVPVIAPSAGPFPFMIEDGVNGLLFLSDSVSDMREKISRLLDDPEFRHKLSRGALEISRQRATQAISFGEALKQAQTQWVG